MIISRRADRVSRQVLSQTSAKCCHRPRSRPSASEGRICLKVQILIAWNIFFSQFDSAGVVVPKYSEAGDSEHD